MLGNKKSGNKKTVFGIAGSTTLISRDTVVVGDIHFNGNLDVEGLVQGNIVAAPEQDAFVRVVHGGRVEGAIHAPSIIINGTIEGDVHATKHLELASHARVHGNVFYTLVEMAAGSEVNGALKHVVEPTSKGETTDPSIAVSKAEVPAFVDAKGSKTSAKAKS